MDVASMVINEFNRFLTDLSRYIDSDNYEYVYRIIFELFYQVAYGKPFLLKNLYKDVRLSNLLRCAKKLIDYVDDVARRHYADLDAIAREILRRVYAVLEELPQKNPRYVILCDGLSIIDTTYIVYRLRKRLMEPFVALLINPGGVTETYKFILEPYAYMQNVNVSLNDVARRVAEKVSAKGAVVLRDHDESIHRLKMMRNTDIVDQMYKLTSRLYDKIVQLKSEFNGVVMLLSDHGYDIVERDPDLYEVNHSWKPHSLSIISSILII